MTAANPSIGLDSPFADEGLDVPALPKTRRVEEARINLTFRQIG
ncbi:MAG: hypothetical protein ACI80V_003666 [Rhodothermales bacterium]|jgi:hypothetical protein